MASSIQSEALELIRAAKAALKEEGVIFASAEDCDFFRSVYRKLLEPVVIPAPVKPLPKPALPKVEAPKEIPEPPRKPESAAPIAPPEVRLHIQERPPQPENAKRNYEEFRKIFSKIAPQTAVLDHIPSDEDAKRIAERWKTKNQSAPFSILTFQEPEPQRLLLSNLAQALEVMFGGARLISAEAIEKDKQWEAFFSVPELKLVIVCDYTLWQMPNLLQFYREVSSKSERFLLNTPLFLLPDLTLYLKDPLLKRSLWKALCQKMS